MDRGARQAKVHSVAKSQTQVKELSMHAHMVTRSLGIPGGSDGKDSDYNAGDSGLISGQEDPLEKEMATHSRILTWRISWTEEPVRLQSMGFQSQTRLK